MGEEKQVRESVRRAQLLTEEAAIAEHISSGQHEQQVQNQATHRFLAASRMIPHPRRVSILLLVASLLTLCGVGLTDPPLDYFLWLSTFFLAACSLGFLAAWLSCDKALSLYASLINKTLSGKASKTCWQNTQEYFHEILPALAPIDNKLQYIEQLEQKFNRLSEQYELVTNNIAAAVLIYGPSRELVYASPYTEVLTGYESSEVQQNHPASDDYFESLVVEKDLERYKRARRVCELGEDILVRYRIIHRSGLRLWLETRMVPVCNNNGDVVSLLTVTIDVTDSLSYQEQIEEQNRDLSDFAYMVSHDLKAPIFTIKGMASAISEDYGSVLGKDGNELLGYIIDGTQRLEKLVASVIEYSSLSTKELNDADVSLEDSVTQATRDLAELIKQKNAKIEVQNPLPIVRGDPIRIYQLFSNLIGNALKYSSPLRNPEIQIYARQTSSEFAAVEVRDNGLGIPADKLEEIFRPYRRAHSTEIEGSGIGLACVKKIAERLGGSVSATSIEGKGSTFTVTLPTAKPKPRQIPEDLARLFT